MPPGKLSDYMLTCIGGLEEVAADELRARLGSSIEGLRLERGAVGRLFFRYQASPRRLLELRCPTGVHAIASQAHDVTVGQPGLERILKCVRQLPVDTVRRIARACDETVDEHRIDLSVSVRGAHRFNAGDVRAGAGQILESQHGWRRGPGSGSPLRLSLQVQKRRAIAAVQLGPRRRSGDPLREGWPGPAADSVVRLLDLAENHPIVALPGGGGADTIWLGYGNGTGVSVRADRWRLPLGNDAVAAALVVPPKEDSTDVVRLLRECARVVVAGGVVVLLAPRVEDLGPRLRQADLPLEALAGLPYHVRRQRWGLFLLERLELMKVEEVTSPV